MKKLFLFVASFVMTAASVTQFSGCGEGKPDACGKQEFKSIEKSGVLYPGHNNLSLSVYDDGGGLVADAACHAEMEVLFTWANSDDTVEPPMKFDFVTVFGYFPPGSVEKMTYNDQTAWVCTVDEAEDKSKPGGTSYGINVEFDTDSWGDTDFPPVDVTLTIGYRIYDSDAYTGTD